MTIQCPGKVQRNGYRPFSVRGAEEDHRLVLRIDDVGVDQHVVGFRDVVADDRLGVGDDLVGQVADAGERAGLDERPVVRHHVGVGEDQPDRLTGADREGADREGQVLPRLDLDRARRD